MHGPAAIAQTHEAWFVERETNKTFEIADLVAGDKIAVCLLHFSADVPDPDGNRRKAEGTSLNTLIRQRDGGWKLLHTSLNMLDDASMETD